MAKEEPKKEEPEETPEAKASSEKKGRIVTWSIVGGIILVFAITGFFLGKVLVETLKPKPMVMAGTSDNLNHSGNPGVSGANGMATSSSNAQQPDPKNPGTEKTWFFDLEPVLANLNEAGATRYVRTTFTLEVFNTLDQAKGETLFKEKMPNMRDWLINYLASLSLDDVLGDKNQKRIQARVLEAFNQTLFPSAPSQIARILLKDFAIQ